MLLTHQYISKPASNFKYLEILVEEILLRNLKKSGKFNFIYLQCAEISLSHNRF